MQKDWTPIPLRSGFSGAAYYRIVAGWVSLYGRVTRTAGNWPSSWTPIADLPSEARPGPALPGSNVLIYNHGSDHAGRPLGVAISHVLQVGNVPGSATQILELSTVSPWSV